MYEVVGCVDCRAVWIREGAAETSTCPRCGTRHRVDRLRSLAETETADAAREARTEILAERSQGDDADIAGYVELDDAVEHAGMSEMVFLTASGIDAEAVADAGERATETGERLDRLRRVRTAVETVEEATEAAIVDAADADDVPPDEARRILERLVQRGEVVRTEGRYRLL